MLQRKINKIFSTIITLMCLVVANNACKEEQNLALPINLNQISADSAISIIKNIKSNVWAQESAKFIAEKNRKNEFQDRDLMLNYLKERSHRENNLYAKNILWNLESYHFLEQGKIDSAISTAKKALNIIHKDDSIKPLNTYHIIGLCFYFQENIDSALFYWQKGYELAEIKKDEKMVGLFATNLGTTYYQSGSNYSARKMFLRGIEAKFRTGETKGVLINNIISTLIDDNKYTEADSFWNKYKLEIKPDPKNYEGQLFLLNRVNLLLMLQRKNEALNLLKNVNESTLHKTLKADYGRVFIHAQIQDKNYQFIREEKWKNFMLENSVFLANTLKQKLLESLNNPEFQFYFQGLYQTANDPSKIDRLSDKEKLNVFEIIGKHQENRHSQNMNYLSEALQIQRKLHEIQLEANIKTSKEFKQIERIIKEIHQKEAIIEKDKSIRFYMWMAILMASVITFLSIWISVKNAKIKKIEKQQWENQQTALQKEHELNNRIVQYSKIIIENNQKLKENLNRLLPMVDEKAKSEIRQMLTGAEVLNTINKDENPAIANQLIGDDEKWEEKFPGFKDLNKTEQRVFVLVQENYKAKEIATLLGVATQYVRNVKTRLRKKLNLSDDWGL